MEQQKLFVPISQEEAGYVSLSAKGNQACANCRFFQFDPGGWSACALISNYPDPVMNTGWCNRWEGEPSPEPLANLGTPLPVVIVEPEDIKSAEAKEIPPPPVPVPAAHPPAGWKPEEPGLFKNLLKTLMDVIRPQSKQRPQFKTLGGGYWVAWYSNNFEDREKEIIAAEAHDRYIARVKAGIIPYPELWYWHIPGSRHGKALWLDRIDHMTVAIGKFDETPFAKVMRRHYEKQEVIYAMSHGFTSDKNKNFKNGVWYDINTFEVSPLAPAVAANVFTLFSEVSKMASEQALEALKAILVKDLGEQEGQKAYEDVVNVSKAMSADAEALGNRYKDFVDPAKADQPGTPKLDDQSKALAPLLIEMNQSQADMLKTQRIQSDQIDKVVKAITEQGKALKDVQDTLSLTPRRASQDPDTALPDDIAFKIKDQAGEYDAFWGDMKVVKR